MLYTVLRQTLRTALAALLLGTFNPLSADKKKLTLEDVYSAAGRAMAGPGQTRFTPDGRLSFFLAPEESNEEKEGEEKDRPKGRDLWILDPASGEKELLLSAEEMRRMAPSPDQAGVAEREHTRRTRFGVAAYRWSPEGGRLLFASAGQIWVYSLKEDEAHLLAPEKKSVIDPKFSPDGKWISFVYEHDIWVVPSEGGKARQLSTGGHELLLHGDLDWVYPEEFKVRTGYHWAPDSRHIAFLEMDQSPVPTYPISDLLGWRGAVDLQRYPKVGDPNPKVRVGIVSVTTAHTVWLDRHAEYIPRIDWADAHHVVVQLLNRGQDELELVLADPATGRSRSIFFERDAHWIDVTNDLRFLEDGEHFLWTSQRSGLRHIYLYDRRGEVVLQLTAGEFRVGEILAVAEAEGWVYFTSNEHNLLGSDLYRVKLDGSERERLTEGKGSHRIEMNEQASAYIDAFSSLDISKPSTRTLHHLPSGKMTQLHRSWDANAEFDLVQPEQLELETPDGALVRVLLHKPKKLLRKKKYPLLIYVYGMPGFPTIRDAWSPATRSLFYQFLVQQGYIVAYVDDRSSSIPGHKYAVLADHNIGPVAAEDHRFAVEHLSSLPYVDAERVGVWGWSGGGFTTSFHMARTEIFKVGIAGAPVTDWRLYDSIYTERYMGQLKDNLEAYERTSAIEGAAEATGRLLLIHGTHDDNVHPQNTVRMMDELIRAQKQFDVMFYPNKTHGIRGKNHVAHLYTLIFDYLERYL